ncbi:MAG TPA: hypothetical protein GXZ90_01185 [Clostridiales bacterium]|nr:hypothetical protein [Clostridiales bacterium]
MNNYLLHNNIKKNLVNVNEANNLNFDNLQIMGGKTGKGKTWYSVIKALFAMKDGKTVLFFTIENSKEEILMRMKKVISNTEALSYITKKNFDNKRDKDKFIDEFIKKSNLIIDDNYLIDDNYIVNKMRKQSQTKEGLNFVIIDGLNLIINNNKEFNRIQELLENVSQELKCEMLIMTQLNKNM